MDWRDATFFKLYGGRVHVSVNWLLVSTLFCVVVGVALKWWWASSQIIIGNLFSNQNTIILYVYPVTNDPVLD